MKKLKKPKGTEHTYDEIEQNKRYKAEIKVGRAITGKKRKEQEKASQERLKRLKPKYLITPMSKKK